MMMNTDFVTYMFEPNTTLVLATQRKPNKTTLKGFTEIFPLEDSVSHWWSNLKELAISDSSKKVLFECLEQVKRTWSTVLYWFCKFSASLTLFCVHFLLRFSLTSPLCPWHHRYSYLQLSVVHTCHRRSTYGFNFCYLFSFLLHFVFVLFFFFSFATLVDWAWNT